MWELSDGSIFLLRECSKVPDLQDFVLEMDNQYGENIFKAIVEGYDDRLLGALQKIKVEGNKPSIQDF